MSVLRKKIAVVGITHPFRGGISHYTTILTRNLMKSCDVLFVSFKRQYPKLLFPGVTQYDYSKNSVSVENFPIIDSICPVTWWKASAKIKAFGASTVIIQWYNPFFAFVTFAVTTLCKQAGITPIIICHNVIPHEKSILNKILTKIAFANCGNFLVHSQADAENLRAIKKDAKILKGYHPTYDVFDYKELKKAEVKKELGIAEEKVLLFFGYVRKYKGLDVLLKAFAQSLKEAPAKLLSARLLVVGEFYENKDAYIDLINALNISDKVTIVDRYVKNEEVAKYFCASDAVVLPYTSASQSGIVQIAYALGRPVIATDAGGLPDVVTDGVTGHVVKSGDVESLRDGIIRFYSNNDTERFKENIKKELDKFSWDALIKVINEML